MKYLIVLGLLASAPVLAEKANDSCTEETRKVAVWERTAPKAPQFARFEDRIVTVCEGKVVSSRKPDEKTRLAQDQE